MSKKNYNYLKSDSNSDFKSNSVSDANSDSGSVYEFRHLYFPYFVFAFF